MVSGPLLPDLAELAPVGTSASSARPCRQPEQDGTAPLTTRPPPTHLSLAPRPCCGPEERCRLRTSCGAAPTVLLLPMTGRGCPGAPDLLPGLTRGGPPGRHPGPAVGTPGPLTLVTVSLQTLVSFSSFLAALLDLWDLTSPTRDRAFASCSGSSKS